MMTEEQAKATATAYAVAHPLDHPDYELEVAEGRHYEAGWLFKFKICCKKDIPKDSQEKFAGAPAVLVEEIAGTARAVGWQEYWKMTK
jgi:hypothetical protein